MRRSNVVVGIVVALGVLGFGAAAVALESDSGGAGGLAAATTTTLSESTTTSTTVAPTTTTVVTPTASTGDATSDPEGDGVQRSTDGCDGGTYATHGDYVSSVAHDPDRSPGDVAAAAQSDCGKPLTAVDGDTSEPSEAPEADTPDAGAPTTPGGPGNGNGNGNGRNK